jgi:hypothetical protein
MENKVKSFVFIHDADILNLIVEKKVFACLENLKYVFLGYGDTTNITTNDLIIARDLPINIEQYKYLVAWTGWYALFKNNIVEKGDTINLFEYDTYLINFIQQKECAYLIHSSNCDETWWNHCQIQHLVEILINETRSNVETRMNVPMTSNYTLQYDESLIEPIEKIISLNLADNQNIGHAMERCYSHILHRLPVMYGMLKHYYQNSHSSDTKQETIKWLSSL